VLFLLIGTHIYIYIYNRSFHKKVGVSNIVERQRYTTVNKLTPVAKQNSDNDNMLIIEDGPKAPLPTKQKTKTTPVVQLFAGNCSSLSEKMREYIIKQHKNFSIWNLVETHERNEKSTFFHNLGYKSCINPAKTTSDLGSHGGEIVACKQHMNVTYIEQKVWDIIRDVSPADIRIAAMIVNISCAQFINATAYLSVGEEFSANNIAIFQQLVMLQNILNLAILAFGDYNIDSYDMDVSGLLKAHNLHILEMPGGPSVKYGSRKIDYIIYSTCLKGMFKCLNRVHKIPFGPHFGYKVTLYGDCNITGTRIHIPYSLPMKKFNIEYESLSGEDRDQKMLQARQEAKVILARQKEKTGFAILGNPPVEILIDKKTPEVIKGSAKVVGEQLALNALTSELYILIIAQISKEEYRHYIGRSQFPLLVRESKQHRGVPDLISKEDLINRVAIVGNAVLSITGNNNSSRPKDYKTLGKFRRYIENNVFNRNENCEFARKVVADYLKDEDWVMLHTMLESHRPKLITLKEQMLEVIDKLVKSLTIHAAYASRKIWAESVNTCFAKYGGKMFQHIGKEDKAFLNVSNDMKGSYENNPDENLEAHATAWESKWHRANDAINKAIHRMLLIILDIAKKDTYNCNTLDLDTYEEGLKGYAKDTRGIDSWTATELRELPVERKKLMAAAMEKVFTKLAQPVQSLINLNPVLGKPSGGTRTVYKTPMTYRISLRARTDVAEWEEQMEQPFDTSGKGKSALMAAAYRGLQAEIYNYTEEQVIGVFHDFENFLTP